MTIKLTMAALVAVISAGTAVSQTADARHYYNHRYYHGHSSYHRGYRDCGGGDGAVGTVAGGVGGALIGNAVGGGTLGTIGGGIGGALLGRTLDKSNTRSRRGC